MKKFNTTGMCKPSRHYMVDIQKRLEEIKQLVDDGEYFVINRARQYGKTTTLAALRKYLDDEYIVVSLDFQFIGNEDFKETSSFVSAFSSLFLHALGKEKNISEEVCCRLESFKTNRNGTMLELFLTLSMWCGEVDKPVVLIIDEVDSASNNQVFLDFLSQLRGGYLRRDEQAGFHSVILAGVYDIKNIRHKIRPDEQHKTNSPWNIAADFNIDMSLSKDGIAGMLKEYDTDHNIGMNIDEMAGLLYDYTSGYPFLVSRICQLIDENSFIWSKQGFLEALKLLYNESNSLFESLLHRLEDYPELEKLLHVLLFTGQPISYNPLNLSIQVAVMLGFIKNNNGNAVVSNRVFSTVLYNYFLSTAKAQETVAYSAGTKDKNMFISDGSLNMVLVLERFVKLFSDIFYGKHEKFVEEEGRRYFLLYLRPIINGVGNYYIESRTLNNRRTDVIIDYRGEQFIVELKIWHGEAYNDEGEKQLSDYLDSYGLKKGYMITFSFNKNKETGIKTVYFEDKVLVEAVV